jgi:hypothetical protein
VPESAQMLRGIFRRRCGDSGSDITPCFDQFLIQRGMGSRMVLLVEGCL